MEDLLITKPWQKSEWKKRREEFIKGKKCIWCGSKERLAIHHTKRFYQKIERKKIIKKFLHQYFNNKKNKHEKKELMVEARTQLLNKYTKICPECGFKVYYRKTKFPKYRCVKCRTETNNPKRKRIKITKTKLRKKFYNIFYNKYRGQIENLFSDERQKAQKEYLEFKDVIVLCSKCHFAYHKGLRLCNTCKTNYRQPKHEKCWNCFQNNSVK